MSNSLEELQVYQRAIVAAHAISALTARSSFAHDPELRRQLRESSARIPANIAEGRGQAPDRHFAHFLYVARGSAREVRAHLAVATGRRHISENERRDYAARFDEIVRMLTGLIRHLEAKP